MCGNRLLGHRGRFRGQRHITGDAIKGLSRGKLHLLPGGSLQFGHDTGFDSFVKVPAKPPSTVRVLLASVGMNARVPRDAGFITRRPHQRVRRSPRRTGNRRRRSHQHRGCCDTRYRRRGTCRVRGCSRGNTTRTEPTKHHVRVPTFRGGVRYRRIGVALRMDRGQRRCGVLRGKRRSWSGDRRGTNRWRWGALGRGVRHGMADIANGVGFGGGQCDFPAVPFNTGFAAFAQCCPVVYQQCGVTQAGGRFGGGVDQNLHAVTFRLVGGVDVDG